MTHKEIEILSEIARKRGGKLLTLNYTNSSTKMQFQCFHGHIFEIVPNSIKQGRWCPSCKKYNRTEAICRVYFEHIFGNKFVKIRPKWLIGNKGNRIELDGYSSDCMVAFEYNGQQHYKKTSWYNFDDNELKRIKENEIIKISKCKEQGVFLVIISYRTKIADFLLEIKRQLIQLNYPGVETLQWTDPSLKSVYTNEVYIEKLKKDLLEKGFSLVDSEYRGETYKYKAICNVCGCERKASPCSLKENSCKRCSEKEKKTIDDARFLAQSRGGECLSDVYVNNYTPLEWKCSCGYVWMTSFNSVQSGNWCPKDGNNQKKLSVKASWDNRRVNENILKLEEARSLANENGLVLVSKEYVSCDAPLVFLCSKKHEWNIGMRAFRRAIKQGRGCTLCGKNSAKDTSSFRKK